MTRLMGLKLSGAALLSLFAGYAGAHLIRASANEDVLDAFFGKQVFCRGALAVATNGEKHR
jgi:hypothetical protein